jgi:hypothetical protein
MGCGRVCTLRTSLLRSLPSDCMYAATTGSPVIALPSATGSWREANRRA